MTIALLLLLLAVLALALVAWRASSEILVPKPYGLMPEFEILGVRGGDAGRLEVRLPPQAQDASQFSRTEAEGRYGLVWEGGAGRLGPVTTREADAVVRPLVVTEGRPPRQGDPARLDVVLFHGDPSDRGLAYEEVRIPGPLGPLPGWWLPGAAEDAVLVLHGRRRADRTESLRILPLLREGGASVLVTSYRNHDVAPASPDGFFHYGATEVEDARAALDWLAERGVRRVLVVGFSMGGAIALELVRAWPADGPEPVGIALDSPLLDPRAAFAAVAKRTGVPLAGPVARLGIVAAGARAGVDFGALDQRRTAPALDLPLLLIGGVADDTVPIAVLDDFAAALPRPPSYLRLDDVQHVEGWNAAPERYEEAVRAFLDRVGPVGLEPPTGTDAG